MYETHEDEAKDAARAVIEDSWDAFTAAAWALQRLCFNNPSDAGNFSLRFEAFPPQFVFTKSAHHLLYYNVPLEDFNRCNSGDVVARKIEAGWKKLDG